jgi:hypothetical protein
LTDEVFKVKKYTTVAATDLWAWPLPLFDISWKRGTWRLSVISLTADFLDSRKTLAVLATAYPFTPCLLFRLSPSGRFPRPICMTSLHFCLHFSWSWLFSGCSQGTTSISPIGPLLVPFRFGLACIRPIFHVQFTHVLFVSIKIDLGVIFFF